MAWTVLAGWRCFLDIAGVLADWNRSDKHLTSGVVRVVRVRRSFKSGVHERRWPTQAQLMRCEIFETSMSWAGSVCGVLCRYLREEGELACLCLVSALVSQPVLWCSVMWRFVLYVARSGNHLM